MGNYTQPGWTNPNATAFEAYFYGLIAPILLGRLNVSDAEYFLNMSITNLILPISLTPDKSYFVQIGNSYGIAFQVIFSVWCAVVIALSIVWMIGQITSRKKNARFPEVAVAVLSLELFQNTMRLV